jgi:peptidoglycan/LPS O-acetylase OafA/YrhL
VIPTIQPSEQRKIFFGPLESLRGVAALLVAVYHVAWLTPIHDAGLVRNSYLMVDMFFVLSGFVMCHGYGGRISNWTDVRDFFVLRLGRLYPLHVTMLGVFLAKEGAKYGAQQWFDAAFTLPAFAENNGAALLSNVLLIHSLGVHRRLTFNVPSWSISAEFYTYIVFALIVLLARHRSARQRLAIFITLSALSCGVLLFDGQPDLNVMYDFGWFRCMMSFSLGAASYSVFARLDSLKRSTVSRLAPHVALVALSAAAALLQFKVRGRSDMIFPPLTAILVVSLAVSPGCSVNRWLQVRPLAYLGKVSYSIYMVHFALAWAFSSVLVSWLGVPTTPGREAVILTEPLTGMLALLLYLVVLLLASHITFTFVEEPSRRNAKAWVLRRRALRAGPQRPTPLEEPSGGPAADGRFSVIDGPAGSDPTDTARTGWGVAPKIAETPQAESA